MVSRFALYLATALCAFSAALAEAAPILPLASHRAAYDISLADNFRSDAFVRSDADFREWAHRL